MNMDMRLRDRDTQPPHMSPTSISGSLLDDSQNRLKLKTFDVNIVPYVDKYTCEIINSHLPSYASKICFVFV